MELAFTDIHWLDNLLLPWSKDECDRLEQIYGPSFIITDKSTRINEGHFVGRYACENFVLYEGRENEFYQ